MSLFQVHLKKRDPSLADRIERIAEVIGRLGPASRKSAVKELEGLLQNPETRRLASGIAAKAEISTFSNEIYGFLKAPNLVAGDYNAYILALGLMEHKPAADYIAQNFLKGNTRAAATFALAMISPEQSEEAFKQYATNEKLVEEGKLVAGLSVLEHYAKKGVSGVKNLLLYVPRDLLAGAGRYFKFPKEVNGIIRQA